MVTFSLKDFQRKLYNTIIYFCLSIVNEINKYYFET